MPNISIIFIISFEFLPLFFIDVSFSIALLQFIFLLQQGNFILKPHNELINIHKKSIDLGKSMLLVSVNLNRHFCFFDPPTYHKPVVLVNLISNTMKNTII